MKQKHGPARSIPLLLVLALIFAVLFGYTSLNLRTIDQGYLRQELLDEKQELTEEIDRLKAEKAGLESYQRIEAVALARLGYQYPAADQWIHLAPEGNP